MLTSSWPADDAQLAGDVDDASAIAWSTVVSRRWILLEHLLDLHSRGEPATAVVDAVNTIEFLRRSLVGSLVVAQDARSGISRLTTLQRLYPHQRH